jgi:hypothetical protein
MGIRASCRGKAAEMSRFLRFHGGKAKRAKFSVKTARSRIFFEKKKSLGLLSLVSRRLFQ